MEEKDGVCSKSDSPHIDPRLQPLIEADDQQYQILLDHLIKEHAEPLVQKIINSRLKSPLSKGISKGEHDDANDLCQDSIIKLIAHLKKSRTNPSGYAISAFDDFVAKVTFNVYNNYVRSKYPHRHKLKRRLEHLLKSRAEFDLWKESSERLAGLAQWRDDKEHGGNNQTSIQTQSFVLAQFGEMPISQAPLAVLLTKLFEWTNQPITFDQLVNVVAEIYQIKDTVPEEWLLSDLNLLSTEQNSSDGIETLEYGEHLRLVWREILALPIRQRFALLLNWKSNANDNIVNALISCGIASIKTIAEALEMKPEDLGKIWDDLPLKDATIGNMLGSLPAQTVVNLRKSARERLARRMNKTRN